MKTLKTFTTWYPKASDLWGEKIEKPVGVALPKKKFRVCWKNELTGATGHGSFLSKMVAHEAALKCNRDKGLLANFSHWVEKVVDADRYEPVDPFSNETGFKVLALGLGLGWW